jgi:hypothetical protein
MQKPRIEHRIIDAKRGVTLEISAYRKLNNREIAATVREALKGKKLKPGTVLRIFASFN